MNGHARGRANREILYRELLAPLCPGDLVPKLAEAAHLLGITVPAAHKALRKALADSGIRAVRERIGNGRCRVVARRQK